MAIYDTVQLVLAASAARKLAERVDAPGPSWLLLAAK